MEQSVKLSKGQVKRRQCKAFREHIKNGMNIRVPVRPKRVLRYNSRKPEMYLSVPVAYKPHAIRNLEETTTEIQNNLMNNTSVQQQITSSRRMGISSSESRHAVIEKKVDRLIWSGVISAMDVKRRCGTICIPKHGENDKIDDLQPSQMLFLPGGMTQKHHTQQRLLAQRNTASAEKIVYVPYGEKMEDQSSQ